MGPGQYPPRAAWEMHPAREPYPRPLVAIVSSAEIAEQGTLSADYWVNREPGETWTAFRVRRQLEDLERRAQVHDEAARKLREQAEELRRTTNQ